MDKICDLEKEKNTDKEAVQRLWKTLYEQVLFEMTHKNLKLHMKFQRKWFAVDGAPCARVGGDAVSVDLLLAEGNRIDVVRKSEQGRAHFSCAAGPFRLPMKNYSNKGDEVTCVDAFGSRVATGTRHGRVEVWERETGVLVASRATEAAIRKIWFCAREDAVASANYDDSVKIWIVRYVRITV